MTLSLGKSQAAPTRSERLNPRKRREQARSMSASSAGFTGSSQAAELSELALHSAGDERGRHVSHRRPARNSHARRHSHWGGCQGRATQAAALKRAAQTAGTFADVPRCKMLRSIMARISRQRDDAVLGEAKDVAIRDGVEIRTHRKLLRSARLERVKKR